MTNRFVVKAQISLFPLDASVMFTCNDPITIEILPADADMVELVGPLKRSFFWAHFEGTRLVIDEAAKESEFKERT